jgi:hypothetical protein
MRRERPREPAEPGTVAAYSLTVDTSAASAGAEATFSAVDIEPLGFDGAGLAVLATGMRLRPSSPLLERTKSAIRGAISARKREPLNTP